MKIERKAPEKVATNTMTEARSFSNITKKTPKNKTNPPPKPQIVYKNTFWFSHMWMEKIISSPAGALQLDVLFFSVKNSFLWSNRHSLFQNLDYYVYQWLNTNVKERKNSSFGSLVQLLDIIQYVISFLRKQNTEKKFPPYSKSTENTVLLQLTQNTSTQWQNNTCNAINAATSKLEK